MKRLWKCLDVKLSWANRVPVLWNLNPNLLEMYHEHCDADVGLHGTGEVGIAITTDEVHADE
jgi:hypothetical protein